LHYSLLYCEDGQEIQTCGLQTDIDVTVHAFVVGCTSRWAKTRQVAVHHIAIAKTPQSALSLLTTYNTVNSFCAQHAAVE